MTVTLEMVYDQQREILMRLGRLEARGQRSEVRGENTDLIPSAVDVKFLAERWGLHPETVRLWARVHKYGLRAFAKRPLKFAAINIRLVEQHPDFCKGGIR